MALFHILQVLQITSATTTADDERRALREQMHVLKGPLSKQGLGWFGLCCEQNCSTLAKI